MTGHLGEVDHSGAQSGLLTVAEAAPVHHELEAGVEDVLCCTVLYCTVLYCTVLYLEGMWDWALTTLFSIMILSIWSWNCLASASTVFFSPSFRA